MHTSQLWGGLHAHFITKFCLSDSFQYQYPIKSMFFSFSSLEQLSIQGRKQHSYLPLAAAGPLMEERQGSSLCRAALHVCCSPRESDQLHVVETLQAN